MAKLVIQVNGKYRSVQATPDTPLLYVLRNEFQLHGPRFGCGLAQCGACTVHLDGEAIRSCVTPVAGGLGQAGDDARGSRQREAAPAAEGVHRSPGAQCGYCTNGMIMAATRSWRPIPTDRGEIKRAMNP